MYDFALGLHFRWLDFNDTLKEIDANGVVETPPATALLLLAVFVVLIFFFYLHNRKK